MNKSKMKLVIGVSGASGVLYAIRLLKALKSLMIETHLVATKTAILTLKYETDLDFTHLKSLADYNYSINDVAASIASGSFKTHGMVVVPCSMKSLSEIAHGSGSNLLTRAADVTLKERRKLVLVPREAPLNLLHIKNMQAVTEAGGIIFPPVPAFYQRPQTIDDIVNDTVGRVLDLFDIDNNLVNRWE